MLIEVVCPHCRGVYHVTEQNVGRLVQCAGCQQAFHAQPAEPLQQSQSPTDERLYPQEQAPRASEDRLCREVPAWGMAEVPDWQRREPPKRRSIFGPYLVAGLLLASAGFVGGLLVFRWMQSSPPAPAPAVTGPPRFSIEQLTAALSDEDPDER